MSFNSPAFLFFFLPVIILIFTIVPQRNKFAVLLAVSLLAYMWIEPAWGIIIFICASTNFGLGLWIGQSANDEKKARLILFGGVLFDILFLFVLKNSGFLVLILTWIIESIKLPTYIATRIAGFHTAGVTGLSFIIFVLVAYLLDVFNMVIVPERNLWKFFFHVFFFPKVFSGPITRYQQTSYQLDQLHPSIQKGVKRFVIGLGKKVLIATPVSIAANSIFSIKAENLTSELAWLGILCYTIQIYFDFSGYIDMAIGTAAFFGFQLPENFNYPYSATSITDFWRRWHITLSNWFRDYIYLPLEFSRRKNKLKGLKYLNILIVFGLTGLWHGISWTFLCWGLLHGLSIGFEQLSARYLRMVAIPIRRVCTLIIIMVGWVFFRSESMSYALNFLAAMFGFRNPISTKPLLSLYISPYLLIALVIGIIFSFPILPWIAKMISERLFPIYRQRTLILPRLIDDIVLILIFLLSLMGVAGSTYQGFIYFQF